MGHCGELDENQEDVPEFRWRGGASPPQGHSDVGPVAPNQCVKLMFGECFHKFPLAPCQVNPSSTAVICPVHPALQNPSKSIQHCSDVSARDKKEEIPRGLIQTKDTRMLVQFSKPVCKADRQN